LKAAVVLEPDAVHLFAVANLLRGILGSSASNLYRTKILQQFPFRTDFGTAGDLAWGLEHSGKIRLAIVPEIFSTFVFHPKSYAKSDYEVQNFNEKCLSLATGSEKSPGESPLISECLSAWGKLLANKQDVAQAKKSALWWASPSAWSAHRRRSAAERQIEQVQQNAMLELSKRVAHDSRPQ
jgi:hypothetical protein